MRIQRILWLAPILALTLLAAPAFAELAQKQAVVTPPTDEEVLGGLFAYSVKFVCGFNRINGEVTPDGTVVGEGQVKLGNYATEINIFNPSLQDTSIANIRKKLVVLSFRGDARGREPEQIRGEFVDGISLQSCSATMDDCNRLYQLFLGAVPPTPPPPMIGYLVLYSDRQIDVTAVYTTEICSDWVQPPFVGGSFMCSGSNFADLSFGAGISIDVERVPGRRIID